MNIRRSLLGLMAIGCVGMLGACVPQDCTGFKGGVTQTRDLLTIATSVERQWTGVAVSKAGRVFVSYPRWIEPYAMGVGELLADGTVKPYPDLVWNAFSADPKSPPALVPGTDGTPAPAGRLVCVQSVHVDANDRLWILDSSSPAFEGVIWSASGPKLIEVDLKSNNVVRVVNFDSSVAPDHSYLNDVRIDTNSQHAFITDSGMGAIVVVDLKTNAARRVLGEHASTKADPNMIPIVGGREVRYAGGSAAGTVPRVHSDGIALDVDRRWLYWQALTSRRLFRAPTTKLIDPSLGPAQLAASVQDLGETVMTDGMEIDRDGNIYFSAAELNAIVMRSPSGQLTTITRSADLSWPDTFSIGPARSGDVSGEWLYVTTSRIHEMPWFSKDAPTKRAYSVLALPLSRQ